MPKILGLNLLGVLVGSVAFYLVGWLWYGILFAEAWMSAMGYTEADVQGGNQAIWMAGGFVITVLQVIGIGLVLKWKGAAALGDAVKTALLLWFFIALPFAHYGYIYSVDHNPTLLMIDTSHLLVGWVVSAVALALIK